LNRDLQGDSRDEWLEEVGEAELVGGWAEIRLAADFVAVIDTSSYQVFTTSYDAVPVFVTNRRTTGFEIHALARWEKARPSHTRCAYHVIARRRLTGD
jgi:hypothetical protein